MTHHHDKTMTSRRQNGSSYQAKTASLLLLLAFVAFPLASGTTDVFCDGRDAVLSCSGGEIIKISEVHYGQNDRYACDEFHPKEHTMKCELSGALHTVKQKCEQKGKCQLTVGRETFVDPCPKSQSDSSKYLSVIYECSPLLESCKGSIWNVTSPVTYTVKKEKQSKGGAWMRDPLQRNSKLYRMESVPFSSTTLWEYSTPENMSGGQAITFYNMRDNIDGTGFVVYDERLYFNKASTREIVKMALHNREIEARFELPHANYHNTSPYAIELDTDIDLAVDENGLWAIYATESNQGLIVISKLDRHALDVMRTYNTDYDKMSALNAFMACGCLYVVNYTSLVIDYKYNTTTELGETIHIAIPGLNRTATSINYNPKDHKLYVWDEQASLYTVDFLQPPVKQPATTPTAPHHRPGPVTPATARTPTTTTTESPEDGDNDNDHHGNGGGGNNGRPPKPERPVTDTPAVGNHRCPSRNSSGLTWPTTSYNEMATLSCPGSGTQGGVATWRCMGNTSHAQWTVGGADFEQCTSSWLIKLQQSIDERNVVNKCNNLLKELQKYELNLRSWDIIATIDTLQALLKRAEVKDSAALIDNFVKISGLLLDNKMADLWAKLGVALKRQTSTRLMGLLEDVGLFFFTDVMLEPDYIPTWSSESVTLRLVIKHSKHIPSATGVTIDNVRVDLRDVIFEGRLGSNDRVAVLFIKFTTIGKYMQDSLHLGSPSYPTNSDLMVVTAASIDTEHPATPKKLQIKSGSVQLRFSQAADFKKQTCAFWNVTSDAHGELDGFWSHKGCRTVNVVGSREVTCQCNHTTPFAVLAANQDFPMAWFQKSTDNSPSVDPGEPGVGEPGINEATLFEFISIVRVGLVFSILVQAIVVVVLALYSHKLDSNTINKNISMSAILTAIVLAFGINQIHDGKLCSVVAVLLHAGILASACWSSLGCLHLLISDERTTENKRWKFYYILGYGIPLVSVVVTVAVDYTVYRGEKICWIDSSSDAIYGVVVPLLAGVVFSVVCVALILRKLRTSSTDLSHQTLKKTALRRSTQKVCILYSLMAAMWSSLIPWMSGTSQEITAWLFCVFTICYSLSCLLLFCVFDTKVRRKCCKWLHHIKKDDFSRHHARNAGRRHLVPPMDHRNATGFPLVNHPVRNNMSCSEDYRPLPPTVAPQRAQTLNFAESQMGMEGGAGGANRPLMGQAASAASLPHDLVANCTASCCGGCRPEENAKFHPNAAPHCSGASSSNSWNNYVQHQRTTSNGPVQPPPTHMTTQVRHCSSCNSNECTLQRQYDRASRTDGHFYEQPVHHLAFCQCTQSSGTSSGCYDHLHDEVGPRHSGAPSGGGGQRRSRSSKCRCNSGGGGSGRNNVVTPPESTCSRPSHFYETLGPFRESPVQQQQHVVAPPQASSSAQQQPLDDSVGAVDTRRQSNAGVLPYNHGGAGPNLDLGPSNSLTTQQDQRYNRPPQQPQQHHRPQQQQQQQTQYFDRSSISSSSAERASNHTSSFERDVLTHHHPHPRTSNQPPRHHHQHRAAVPYAHRCDPRSIRTLPEDARLCDAGDDVDETLHPRIKASFTCTGGCRGGNATRNGRSSDPLSTDQGYDTDSQMQNRREITPPRDDIQIARRTELKRLVKPPTVSGGGVGGKEITFSDSENDLEVENIIGGSEAVNDNNDMLTSSSSHHHDHDEDAIDTERGGLISPSDTVTSWAALGPDPYSKAPDPSSIHALLSKRQYNSASTDGVTVAQQQQQRRNSSYGSGSEGPCSYTLPGTSDAATKARIDLRTGGVNMITNL